MAAEVVDCVPSPPLQPSATAREREAMSTCQTDVRLEAGQAAPTSVVQQQQLVGLGTGGEMAQPGVGELSLKMLMSSRVSYYVAREISR